MAKIKDLIAASKLKKIMNKDIEVVTKKNTCLKVLAVIGVIAVIAGVVYAIHKCCSGKCCCDDYDDEFDDVEEFFEDED